MKTLKSNDYIEDILREKNLDLAAILESDVIYVNSPIRFGLDDAIKLEVEHLCEGSFPQKRKRLSVVLETTGGFIETVERIYDVFRAHFREVDFIVPNYAYSAGTVLALSGDRIFMDYYSVLGPIDPQTEDDDGKLVPGLGYLTKFNELVDKINNAPLGAPPTAEVAYLLKRFDPARLFALEQAKKHSATLLELWLSRHKFKNWRKTQDRRLPVDDNMRRERGKKIAEILGDPETWHSHGRGIGLKDLTSDRIKLKIDDFGRDPKLSQAVHSYYNLITDFCQRNGFRSAIHTAKRLRRA